MTHKQLIELSDQIKEAETRINGLNGRMSILREMLLDRWGCSTIKEAEKEADKMAKTLEGLEVKRETMVQKLKEKYDL